MYTHTHTYIYENTYIHMTIKMRKREYEFERYQAKLLGSKNKKGKREAMQLQSQKE